MPSDLVFYFIHGFPDSEKVWEEYVTELKKSFPKADYLFFSSPQGQKIESLGQLKELHMNNLKNSISHHKKIVLVAHDLGVPQAWILAKYLQTSLKALVLYNGLSVHQLKFRLSDLAQVKRSWYIGAFLIPGAVRFFMKPDVIAKQLVKIGKKDPDFRFQDYYLYRILSRALLENPIKLKVPVFQMSSRRDPFILPLKNFELEREAFEYEHEIFDGGHWSIQEDPRRCVKSAVDFLKSRHQEIRGQNAESL
jgi:pimeloyl-ACP methyl ester carboxylesterase